jgi:hypothetical protein
MSNWLLNKSRHEVEPHFLPFPDEGKIIGGTPIVDSRSNAGRDIFDAY